jgi:hypothetical protein
MPKNHITIDLSDKGLFSIPQAASKAGVNKKIVSLYSRRLNVSKIKGIRYFNEGDIKEMLSLYKPKAERKTADGLQKRGGKFRVSIGVNGLMYYLGTANTHEEAVKLKNTANAAKQNNTFDHWYGENYTDFEEKRAGKFIALAEACNLTGYSDYGLRHCIEILELKLYENRRAFYLTLSDLEKIRNYKERKEEERETRKAKKTRTIKIGKPRAAKDIMGLQINNLTAVEFTGKREKFYKSVGYSYVWVWRCVCGKTFEMSLAEIRTRRKESCGCVARESRKQRMKEMHKKTGLYKGTMISLIKSKRVRQSSLSGVRGVSFLKTTGKYYAYITLSGKRHYLGLFDKIEDAEKARKKAEEKYFNPLIKEYYSHKRKC